MERERGKGKGKEKAPPVWFPQRDLPILCLPSPHPWHSRCFGRAGQARCPLVPRPAMPRGGRGAGVSSNVSLLSPSGAGALLSAPELAGTRLVKAAISSPVFAICSSINPSMAVPVPSPLTRHWHYPHTAIPISQGFRCPLAAPSPAQGFCFVFPPSPQPPKCSRGC